jgi:hypothetical protein
MAVRGVRGKPVEDFLFKRGEMQISAPFDLLRASSL